MVFAFAFLEINVLVVLFVVSGSLVPQAVAYASETFSVIRVISYHQ